MDNLLIRKILTSLLYIVLAVVLEMFLFLSFGWGLFPAYFAFDIGMILFLGFVIFSCGSRKLSNILFSVFISIQIILGYINLCVKASLDDVFSFSMIQLVGETVNVITPAMFPWVPIIFYAFVVSVMIISLVLLRKIPVEKETERKFSKTFYRLVVLVGISFSMMLYSFQTFFIKSSDDENLYLLGDDYLYSTMSSSKLGIRKFGTFGFYFEELFRTVYNPGSLELPKINKRVAADYNPQDSVLFGVANKDGKKENVIIIMAESFEWYAISDELTPLLYALANGADINETMLDTIYTFDDNISYYPIRNDYTRLQTADSISYTKKQVAGVDVNVYGDIYSENEDEIVPMYGMTLANYYSKAKTDHSEAEVILGNYPYNKSFSTSFYGSSGAYDSLDFCFSLPNTLEDSGYSDESLYVHGNASSFYGRNINIPKFGFDDTLFWDKISTNQVINDLNVENPWTDLNDSMIVKEYINKFLHITGTGETKEYADGFLSFITTLTTHGDFQFNEREALTEHFALVDATDYLGKNTALAKSDTSSVECQVRSYLAKCVDTEFMIANLIDGLVENDMLDNTTIVFYADHNSYYDGLDLSYKSYYYSDSNASYQEYREQWLRELQYTGSYGTYSSERYAVPAFIWSKSIDTDVTGFTDNSHTAKYQYISKFCNSFDLNATIMTMCGIKFNPEYYCGYPILCTGLNGKEIGASVIVSHTGSFFNNKIFSEDGFVAKYTINEMVTEEEIKTFSYAIVKQIEKRYYINSLYDSNGFTKTKHQLW